MLIEVNPRLTTSYVGLRHVMAENLAAAMLTMAEGGSVALSWNGRQADFAADGTVRQRSATQ